MKSSLLICYAGQMDGTDSPSYPSLIRYVYLAMGVILFISTAFLKYQLPFPSFFSFLIVIVLIVTAGFTTSRFKLVIVSNFIVSIAVFTIFGWQTFLSYNSPHTAFFWTSLILSLLSMFALYYSTRNVRYNLYKFYPNTDV